MEIQTNNVNGEFKIKAPFDSTFKFRFIEENDSEFIPVIKVENLMPLYSAIESILNELFNELKDAYINFDKSTTLYFKATGLKAVVNSFVNETYQLYEVLDRLNLEDFETKGASI